MDNILIVDDDQNIRNILSRVIKEIGCNVFEATNGHETFEHIKKNYIDLILLDYKLPDINGIEILKKLTKHKSPPAVIMITGHGDIKNSVKAMKLGADDYLTKPIDNDELIITIEKTLKTIHLTKEVQELRNKFDEEISIKEMMGNSKQINTVLDMIKLIAEKDITVLLVGKTGTGKDLIAKLIHQKSHRRDGPFVAIDAGAIPESLFEAELFGYEKGAFTGAVSNRMGKFEQANGGTLFLDEINNIPLTLQPKFLRALEEREIQRLGSSKTKKIDVRIMVASNTELTESVRTNKFREDLLFRLQEFKINIPTLTQRKADIPVISNYFIKEINSTFKTDVKGISKKAIDTLLDYKWPGNVRELKNVIKRAAIMCKDNFIEREDLVFISSNNPDFDATNKLQTFDINELLDKTLPEILQTKEKEIYKKVLKFTKQNKTKAADILGISRWKFYRRAKEFNL